MDGCIGRAPHADDAIALLNTVRGGLYGADDATDSLDSFQSLVRLVRELGLVPAASYERSSEGRALSAFRDVVALRTALDGFLSVEGSVRRDALVDRIDKALDNERVHMSLAFAPQGGWIISPRYSVPDPFNIVFAFGLAIVSLLQNTPLETVKRCEATDCVWFFIDTTKNGSRRWCSAGGCGERVRARRHYRKVARTRSG